MTAWQHYLLLYAFLLQYRKCGGTIGTTYYKLQLRYLALGLCGEGTTVTARHFLAVRHSRDGSISVRATPAGCPVPES